MAYPDPPKSKNLTVTHLRPELHNLYIALSEIEGCSRAELLEALLFPFVKNWIDQRERNLDVDPSVRYMRIDQAPNDQREAVLKRMSR